MDFNFTGKVVLVTGGSSGIGKATAQLFAKLGATVAIVGRNAERLNAVAKTCEQEKGVKALAIIADVSTDAGCEKVANDVKELGRLDILVNNAGASARGTIESCTMEGFDSVFNTNVRGVYNLTRLVVPELIKTKGNIINISSIVNLVMVGSLSTDMTKATIDHFTRLVALELAPKGVRVNAVAPGITATEGLTREYDSIGASAEGFLKEANQVIPLGRVCTGDDIARMIVFLCSEHSSLVTGTIVHIDGCLQYGGPGGLGR